MKIARGKAAAPAAILGPLLAACVLLAARQSAAPADEAGGKTPASMPLPELHAQPLAEGAAEYAAIPGSSRFVLTVAGSLRTLRGVVEDVAGHMTFKDGKPDALHLAIELAKLRPLPDDADDIDAGDFQAALSDQLGLQANAQLLLDGKMASRSDAGKLPLQRVQWSVRTRLGTRAANVRLELWQTSLAKGTIHAQGVASIDGKELSAPTRYRFGVWPDCPRLTFGFDLELALRR